MSALNFNKLQAKHVLLIGGSSGIGFAVAQGALASGAHITTSSSSQPRIDSAVTFLKSLYPDREIFGLRADLSNAATLESDLEALFKSAVYHNGPVHHVVFTAADSLALGSLDALAPELILRAAHFRMVVPLMVGKMAARFLKERTCSLTITTGCVAEKPGPGWAVIAYCAGGLVSLAKALAVDLAPVRVNVVQAGYTDTPLWQGMDEEARMEMFRGLEEKMLTGKMGQVEDVAEAFLWVMKDGNVTATVAKSDGGVLVT